MQSRGLEKLRPGEPLSSAFGQFNYRLGSSCGPGYASQLPALDFLTVPGDFTLVLARFLAWASLGRRCELYFHNFARLTSSLTR